MNVNMSVSAVYLQVLASLVMRIRGDYSIRILRQILHNTQVSIIVNICISRFHY